MTVPIEELDSFFRMDADGHLYKRTTPARGKGEAGSNVGEFVGKNGYKSVTMGRRRFYTHRVVFALCHWRWPNIVDHINGNRLDNRPENLREVTYLENSWNSGWTKNATGYCGVHKHRRKFVASIFHKGRKRTLGLFETAEEAGLAYQCAVDRLRGQYGRSL